MMLRQSQQAYFWRSGNAAEVDIIIEAEGRIIPMEVKAAANTRAKSYRQFCKRYMPEVGFKLSMRNIGQNLCENTRTMSLPLWMCWNWRRYLE